jgi:DNA (cytosine-5)-methyltransferase 1
VVLENVPGLLDGGASEVFGSLAGMGYDSEWGVLSACAFGAPHTRERVFVIAYSDRLNGETRFRVFPNRKASHESPDARSCTRHWLDAFTGIPGMVDGIPGRMDRIRCLGNAVVPAIAEWLGNLILEREQ